MTERKPANESWESFVERQIQDAKADGEFEALPGFGKPCDEMDAPLTPDWWLKKKLKRERVSVLPPALEIKRDVERELAAIKALSDESRIRKRLAELNERIRAANLATLWGPPSTMMEIDIDSFLTKWRRSQSDGEA